MMQRLTLGAILLLSLSLSTRGKIYQGIEELPPDLGPFDFIVAGGGTGGCVVASRLTENRRFNVLLVEAGSDTEGVIELIIPAWASQRNHTEYEWSYVSAPQPGLNGRTLDVLRGRGLGGSSAINGMVYARGSADDYDNWGRVTGDRRWSWDALEPYIKRNERWLRPAGGRDVTGQFDPTVHGYTGNVQTSLPWDGPTDHDLRTIRNGELQKEFACIKDQNAGSPLGPAQTQSTIGNGERSSSATAYLGPSVRKRPNLTILLNTHVTRVLPAGNSSRALDIRRVELAARSGGEARRVLTATKEIIVSGGVIGTPQILLNSGIGNQTTLEALGIHSILDLPDVGQGLTEHVAISAQWSIIPQTTLPIDEATALAMWKENRTGPLTQRFPGHQILWSRIPRSSPIFESFEDPSTGPTSPHITGSLGLPESASLGVLTPYSRGSVTLQSTNPFDHPIIDLGLLSHPFDILALKEGIRLMKRFYSGAAWDGYITGFRGPDPDALPEAEIDKAIRDTAFTFFHPVGTASMSSKYSKRGVVDGELRVKDTNGLRIVDASVFPYVLSANTQAGVYILAERAVDLIRDSW